jgi:hypothetical protein
MSETGERWNTPGGAGADRLALRICTEADVNLA